MFILDIEINFKALKEIFGQNAQAAFLKFSEKMQSHYSNIGVRVSAGPLTTVEGLNGIHLFDEYGDVAEIIDKLMSCVYQENFEQQANWFPDSFCEFSTGDINDARLKQSSSDWNPEWSDNA